tara:strand:+ start:1317 stop:2462 length:1146 start_codon:yes stop_codon:yes gene_type:complete
MKIVLIPIETSVRENDYKLLLAAKLKQNGFNAIVGYKGFIHILCKCLNNYIYIDKGFHDGVSQKLYKLIKSRSGIIYSLDDEGAIDFEDNHTLYSRYEEDLLINANKIFFWGEFQRKLILNKFPKYANKCVTTGHPRFFSEFLQNRTNSFINHLVKNYSKVVLIVMNCGFGNNKLGDEYIIKNYSSRWPFIKEIIKNDKIKLENLESFIDTYKIENNKKQLLIIRPHPEESFSFYEKFECDNILVTSSHNVVDWLKYSDEMYHYDSTVAVESILMNKPTKNLPMQNLDENFMTMLPIKITRSNHEEGLETLSDYFLSNEDPADLIISEMKQLKHVNTRGLWKFYFYRIKFLLRIIKGGKLNFKFIPFVKNKLNWKYFVLKY